MGNIEIYFDGFCPESHLAGKQVEMRLNVDDFWESVETRLQIAVFPPYATILQWRGKGALKASSKNASDLLTGLVMAKASKEEGKEIFPDENGIIYNSNDLRWYVDGVFDSREEYQALGI